MTAGGSIASLGSPESLAVVFSDGGASLELRRADAERQRSDRSPVGNSPWRIIMEAQIENDPLSAESVWHIAPAENARKDRIVRELNGVPKGALRTVFGKVLGRRIWEQVRRPSPPASASHAGTVGDANTQPNVA